MGSTATGSVFRRGPKKWQGQITLPSGKRKSVYGNTKQEAQRKLAEVRREIDAGLHGTRDADGTFGAFYATWFAGHKSELKPNSVDIHALVQKLYITDIADIALNELRAIQIQHMYTALLERGLSTTTVRKVHNLVREVMRAAVRLGVIPRDPTEQVVPPKARRLEYVTLTRHEVTRLVEAAFEEPLGPLYAMAVTTGLRQGELLALEWEDLTLDGRKPNVKVAKTLYLRGDVALITAPKTRTSRRTVPLAMPIIALLRQRHTDQLQERDLAGEAWDTRWNLIFANAIGQPWPAKGIRRRFAQFLARNQLPLLRFHDLRHTFATLLIEDGVQARVVSELLGHSSVNMTLSLYAHVTPRMQDQATAAIEAWLKVEEENER